MTSTATYDCTAIAGLGLDLGTFSWSWGSGMTADTFTVIIGSIVAPEPATFAVLGAGLSAALLGRRRRKA